MSSSAASRRLQTLAYELTVAEARERQRVAHLLHDEIGQLLAMAQLRLSELKQALAAEPATGELVEDLRALLVQASQATRTATYELHSPVLQQLGLQAAIESLTQRLARNLKVQVHLQFDQPEPELADAVRSVLLRTVRELILNAQKHAQPANLWIAMHHEYGALVIKVRDDGVGFVSAGACRRFTPDGGFGLTSAEAQMRAIGGALAVDSAPGSGTTVTLTLPTRIPAGSGPLSQELQAHL